MNKLKNRIGRIQKTESRFSCIVRHCMRRREAKKGNQNLREGPKVFSSMRFPNCRSNPPYQGWWSIDSGMIFYIRRPGKSAAHTSSRCWFFIKYGQMPPSPADVNVVETNSESKQGQIHSSYDFVISKKQQSLTFRGRPYPPSIGGTVSCYH